MKKIVIAVLLLAALGIGLIPIITSKMAEGAFLHPNDAASQDSLKKAITWKMRMYQFADARKIAEKAIIWFPESPNLDAFLYCAALSAEREKAKFAAAYWYSEFLKRFPEHPWAVQAKASLERLQAAQ